jgi:putative spermidine/putrescine transport system substrate-binding protein
MLHRCNKNELQEIDDICTRLRTLLLETRGFDRRQFITALGRAFAGSTVLSMLPHVEPATAAPAEPPVTAFVFGGVWKKSAMAAFGEPFTQATGIPVVYQDPYTFAKLRAMHEAKAMQVDVASVQGGELFQAERRNMIMPLDFSIIDRTALADGQVRRGNAIGGHSLSYVICYSKKKWPGEHHPNSWADFWDVQKFPGRRVLRREEIWTTEAALKADSVKDDAFYPIDVARAFRSLDRIKSHIKAWYSDNSQAQQLMEQEEVDLIAMMNGRATETIRSSNAPFEIVWNEAICDGGAQGWIAPVGCPNPKGAMKFLDFVGRAEYQAVFARLMYYAPQNPRAFDLLEPEIAKLMPTYPENEKLAHLIKFEWWADNLPMMQRRFQQWLQS